MTRENKALGVDIWRVLEGVEEGGKIENPLVGGCEFHEHGKGAVCSSKGGERKREEMPNEKSSSGRNL